MADPGSLPTPRTLWLGLLCALFLPLGASAQSPRWQVDLNGSRIEYDTLDALNAPSLATAVEWQSRVLLARLAGSLTGFEDAGRTLQGRGDVVGWFSPAGVRSPLRLEAGGSLQGSSHSSGFDAYLAQVAGRAHFQQRTAGGWVGLEAGTSKNSLDPEAVTNVSPEVGGWAQVGPTRLVARYADVRVEGDRFPEATVSALYSRGRWDVTAYLGVRGSPYEEVDGDSWLAASATVWLQDRLALLLSGGTYAPDVLQGLPGGTFLSVGIRYAPRRVRPVAPAAPLPLMFTRESARSGRVGFTVPNAGAVAIAGDWNEWQPTPLTRGDDGRWLLPSDVPAGVHRFNLLVNGEVWMVPEGIPAVDDGFGGQVGLLVISES